MTEPLRLVSAIDHNYVVPWSAMIASLRSNNESMPLTAYVLQYDLASDDVTYLQRVAAATDLTLHVVRISRYPFSLFHTRDRSGYIGARSTMPPIAYAKSFVDRLLPSDVNRILTIDADIIVSGRVDELLTMEISKPLAAVANATRSYGTHFNSGFMLIDLDEWRRRRISEIAHKFLLVHSAALHTHDQQVLNLIFGDNWHRLSPKWNLTEDFHRLQTASSSYSSLEVETAYQRPTIIHFKNRADKPWLSKSTHPRADLYHRYVEQLRAHRTGLNLYDPAEEAA